MPGPPPKPDAVRRNARVGTVKLPAAGRKGRLPTWPLIDDVVMGAKRDIAAAGVERMEADLEEETDPRKQGRIHKSLDQVRQDVTVLDRQIEAMRGLQSELWAELWRMPQAVAWERNGWTRDVAQYVRHKVMGELGSLEDAKEARMWSDRLGLNPKAMRALLWEVAEDEVAGKREEKSDARKRIKAV